MCLGGTCSYADDGRSCRLWRRFAGTSLWLFASLTHSSPALQLTKHSNVEMNEFLQGDVTAGEEKPWQDEWRTLRRLSLNFHCCIICITYHNMCDGYLLVLVLVTLWTSVGWAFIVHIQWSSSRHLDGSWISWPKLHPRHFEEDCSKRWWPFGWRNSSWGQDVIYWTITWDCDHDGWTERCFCDVVDHKDVNSIMMCY